jgi:hypothetical protein
MAFGINTYKIGGNSVLGKIENGNYYLMNEAGKYIQTASTKYFFNLFLFIFMMVNFLVVFICFIIGVIYHFIPFAKQKMKELSIFQ